MRKLTEELPVITTPSRAMSGGPIVTANVNDSPSPATDDTPWLDRTDISSALKQASANTWTFHIRSCESAEMQRVLHASFDRGIRYLALGGVRLKTPDEAENLVTPFGLHGMERISLGALITSAEALGYNAEYDIVQRLQTGSERKYIAPLRTYTMDRLRLYRSNIKKAAASAYPSAVRLPTSVAAVHRLIDISNFIYPPLPDDKFKYTQPFSGPGLADVVRAAFFGDSSPYQVGLQNINSFTSSLPSAPHEREIPEAMLAMAATAILAVLFDQSVKVGGPGTGAKSEFGGATFDTAFKQYMNILVKLRQVAPAAHHALLHGICIHAIGKNTAVNDLSHFGQDSILGAVDWANIADSNDG
ncbi:hypothetical protein C8Q77DRAFT_71064 [Trametes polyzona]|nr:hypothetical protein C8Q77DRAFT_71064 [Trametes polyzona]